MPKKTKEQMEINTDTIKKKTTKSTTKNDSLTTKESKVANTSNKVKTVEKNSKSITTKKATKAISNKKKTSANTKKTKVNMVEYYDLPNQYDKTIIKVLAQTPTNLFVYWEISSKDKENFQKQYGKDFFETTKPILIINNNTLGYSFEVEINDFANSWYLQVSDSRCDYKIELGRRPIIKNKILDTDYIHISSSNEIESPNDHILFDNNQKMVYFKDVQTGVETKKEMTSISLIKNMGKIYNIYDLYKTIYKEEKIYDLSNPSS